MAPNILSDDIRSMKEFGLALALHQWQGLDELDKKCPALILLPFKPYCYANCSFNKS